MPKYGSKQAMWIMDQQYRHYERLVLECWTDGTVTPDRAVALGAKLLRDHLAIFVDFDEEPEAVAPKGKKKAAARAKKPVGSSMGARGGPGRGRRPGIIPRPE